MRLVVCENFFFVGEDFRQVHFDPLQRFRELHAVRPGIQSRGKIHDHVRALLQFLGDELVEKIGARHPGPGVLVTFRQRVGNVHTVLPGEAFGAWMRSLAGYLVTKRGLSHALIEAVGVESELISSCWMTTSPVGKWVIRTALSVVFTD